MAETHEVIETGDVVYQRKKGWSGVCMQVLEIVEVSGELGIVAQALCKGVRGWDVNGLYSTKYGVRVAVFAVANLTKVPDSATGDN